MGKGKLTGRSQGISVPFKFQIKAVLGSLQKLQKCRQQKLYGLKCQGPWENTAAQNVTAVVGTRPRATVWEGLPDCGEEMNTQEKEHHTNKKCHLTFRNHWWEAEQGQLKSTEETKERQLAALGFDTPTSAGSSNQTELGEQLKLEDLKPHISPVKSGSPKVFTHTTLQLCFCL